MIAFGPTDNGTSILSVSDTTGNVELAGDEPDQVVITNTGSVVAYCRFGTSGVTVAVPSAGVPGGFPVLAGVPICVTKSRSHTHLAAITASSTTTLMITPGLGR